VARSGSTGMRVAGFVLLIGAILLLATGLVYFAVAADKLPSFLGRLSGVTVHRTKRATAAVVLGGIALIASIVAFSVSYRRASSEASFPEGDAPGA